MFCKFDTSWLIEGVGECFCAIAQIYGKGIMHLCGKGVTQIAGKGFMQNDGKGKNQRPPLVQREDDSGIKRHNNAIQLQLCLGHALLVAERSKMADTLGYFN